MNLINKKLLQQKFPSYEFPSGEKKEKIDLLISQWQKALKDSDLENTKEKSIQGKFLQTFFEHILGYNDVTSGEAVYTLIQHPRIENNTGEPDGSLGFFTKDDKDTRVVIELKDARTNLDKKQSRQIRQTPVDQAFNYASKEDKCKWVIVSNFKEIRLYSKLRSQEYYEKFLVANLGDEVEFKRFYFLLTKDNLIQNDGESTVEILAQDTNQQEQDITKDFYAKYKELRLLLLNHLIDNNPEIAKELLIEKTQKLLDRLIFTLFCEDTTELLPYEIVKTTYERALSSFSNSDSNERVWTEFKGLFRAIDQGNSRVIPPINAYNGGLFKTDEVLDSLTILDGLWQNILKLADYDYQTDLNVNILGHIFEQSISDLEEIKADYVSVYENTETKELTAEPTVKVETVEKKGKRKKDGIFYTPEYITQYIVDNTVGRYLEEKPEALENIKILDPACGSGAFLNQAHTYLLQEYENRYQDRLREKKEAGEDRLDIFEDYNPTDVNKGILLNNLFGVDLNQESVEITKLALWLKTARKTEPLQNLDKNIKCGDSLIDDNTITNKAFNWQEEYKDIFEEGGFDIVIANPPYVNIANIRDKRSREFFQSNYATVHNKSDLYSIFTEKAIQLLKTNGILGFIFSNSWMGTQSFQLFRKHLLENLEILELVKLPDNVFADATVKTVILIARKKAVENAEIELKENKNFIFEEYPYKLTYEQIKATPSNTFAFEKRFSISGDKTLGDCVKFSLGIKTSNDKRFIVNYKKDEDTHPMVRGRNIQRYNLTFNGEFMWYKPELMKERVGAGPRKIEHFRKTKVLIQDIAQRIISCVDREGYLTNDTVSIIYDTGDFEPETIVALLNSTLINRWFKSTYPNGLHIKRNQLETIPIPSKLKVFEPKLKEAVLDMEAKIQDLVGHKAQTVSFLEENYDLVFSEKEKRDFHSLGWNTLEENHKAQIGDLDIHKKEELHSWFREKVGLIRQIDKDINGIQMAIDNMIYDVYELSEDDKNYFTASEI